MEVTELLESSEPGTTTGYHPIGYLYSADLSAVTMFEDTAIDLRIEVEDGSGNTGSWVMEPAFTIGDVELPVGVADAEAETEPLPVQFALHANYPNPFNNRTVIDLELPFREDVRLSVYDLLGREVAVLVEEEL